MMCLMCLLDHRDERVWPALTAWESCMGTLTKAAPETGMHVQDLLAGNIVTCIVCRGIA